GKPLPLQLQRGDKTLELTAVPQGPAGAGRLGIKFSMEPVGEAGDYTLTEAVVLGSRTVVYGTGRILDDVARMLRPGEKVELGGPPEIVSQLKKAANKSLRDFFWLLATLSVMLG